MKRGGGSETRGGAARRGPAERGHPGRAGTSARALGSPDPRRHEPSKDAPAPRPNRSALARTIDAKSRGPRADAERLEIVYGLRAGLAVIAARPSDLVRVACAVDPPDEVRSALERLAALGIPCDELPSEELERVSDSSHHEGLVVAARPRPWLSPRQLSDLLVAERGVAIALDRVKNPYNIGAILRSAAFFGVDAVLLSAMSSGPELARNAVRVAEGGTERLALARTSDLGDTLSRLRDAGVHVVGADGSANASAFEHDFPRPTILVMGHEREGLSSRIRLRCDALISIPGSGRVESLNVGVAAGILAAELVRRAR